MRDEQRTKRKDKVQGRVGEGTDLAPLAVFVEMDRAGDTPSALPEPEASEQDSETERQTDAQLVGGRERDQLVALRFKHKVVHHHPKH